MIRFPSPYGDYGSYLKEEKKVQTNAYYVSVPLRGLWFLSTVNEVDQNKVEESFRPLTGIMVLIVINLLLWIDFVRCFRPLTGIMVLIAKKMQESLGIPKCFRPLTGIMVLICRSRYYEPPSRNVVSVPLRGLWFLSRQ